MNQMAQVSLPLQESKTQIPSGRGGASLVSISENKLLLLGGASRQIQFDDVWCLTIDAKATEPTKWTKLIPSSEIENDVFLARNSHTAFVNPQDRAIYLFGGSKLSEHYSDLYKFKIQGGDSKLYKCRNITEQAGGSIKAVPGEWPDKRASFASAPVKGGFIIHGGANQNGPLDDTLRFEFKTEIWTRLVTGGIKPDPRQMHSGAYLRGKQEKKGKFFIFGGRVNRRAIEDSIYSLDLNNNQWSKLDVPMPHNSCAHCSTMVSNNKVFLYGGTNGGIPFFQDILLFDLEHLKWRTLDLNKLTFRIESGTGSQQRQRIQSACSSNNLYGEDSQFIVIYGGASIEGDHSDILVLQTEEVLNPKNSQEIDKII